MFTIYAELSGIPGLQSKEVQTLEQFVAEPEDYTFIGDGV